MIKIVDHPLVMTELTILRDKRSSADLFRQSMKRLCFHLATEAYRELKTAEAEVETPFEKVSGHKVADSITIMPVLRAGLSMLEPFQTLLPEAHIGFIGLWKNEYTNSVEEYHFSLPSIKPGNPVFLLDPMIATGQTICSALSRLQIEGADNVTIVTVIAAPEGIEQIKTQFPEAKIITAALDRAINSKGYILPGLGDAGDRFTGRV
jgi:uracil phosphoribosyltransferase